jgi:catechol 2,3-dioxygenase-like lactoylglutathione lyase family enzyme
MNVEFVAGFAVIAPDPDGSAALYRDILGLPLAGEGEYLSTEELPGTRHFGIWPLARAASACFGRPEWPADLPTPQATIEFEVAAADLVAEAASELHESGYRLLHGARTEPWGQVVARLLGPEGLIVGISYAPWMHEDAAT